VIDMFEEFGGRSPLQLRFGAAASSFKGAGSVRRSRQFAPWPMRAPISAKRLGGLAGWGRIGES
jgi:hypothetical protein